MLKKVRRYDLGDIKAQPIDLQLVDPLGDGAAEVLSNLRVRQV